MINHFLTSAQRSRDDIAKMKAVQQKVIGNPSEVTAEKARWCETAGRKVGGVALERDEQAVALGEGNRCYPAATSYQGPRDMNAPHMARKTRATRLTPHGELMREVLEVCVGIYSSISMLTGTTGYDKIRDVWAEKGS